MQMDMLLQSSKNITLSTEFFSVTSNLSIRALVEN